VIVLLLLEGRGGCGSIQLVLNSIVTKYCVGSSSSSSSSSSFSSRNRATTYHSATNFSHSSPKIIFKCCMKKVNPKYPIVASFSPLGREAIAMLGLLACLLACLPVLVQLKGGGGTTTSIYPPSLSLILTLLLTMLSLTPKHFITQSQLPTRSLPLLLLLLLLLRLGSHHFC